MNIRHSLLLFFLFQFSIIVGYCQPDGSVQSIYNAYAKIDNDFERLDSIKFFIHPKTGHDMRQSIELLELERTALGSVNSKPLQHVLVNNLLFKCYRSINEYQKGATYLMESRAIAKNYSEENEEWESALAELSLETAFVFFLEQNPEKAFAEVDKALVTYKKLGNNKKLAESFWRLGIAKSQMGKTQDALTCYDKAEKLIDQKLDQADYLRVQYLKSIELTLQNKFVVARRTLKPILPQMKETNHINYAVTLAKMGQVETQLGNLIPAKKYLTAAELLKINTNDLNAKAIIAHRFEEYYLATGQFQDAYDQLAIRKSIADSVSRKRMKQDAMALQTRVNSIHKQQEAKDDKYEQVIQESRLKSWLGILSGGLLAILAFILYRKRNKVKEEPVKIAEPNHEEITKKARKEASTVVTENLRTPLALINGQLGELKNEPLSNHASSIVNASHASSNLLFKKVNQMEDIDELKEQTITLKETDGDLVMFLQDFIERLEANAQGKGIIWNTKFEQESFPCKLDYGKLNSILANLASNVINYCPSGTEVNLAFAQKRDYVVIEFSDNGPGIDQAHQQHILNWYFRKSDGSNTENESGSGLALSNELAKLMNGQLTLTSNVDRGCHFIIDVPFKKVDEVTFAKINEMVPPTTETKTVETKQPAVAKTPIVPIAAAATVVPVAAAIAPRTPVAPVTPPTPIAPIASLPQLLLVEDQLDLSKRIQKVLSNQFEVTAFPTASAAESWAMENMPDVILTDLRLPDMSGFELSAALKSNFITDHIPILLLTDRADKGVKEQSLTSKIDAILTKPINGNELIAGLKNLIAQQKQVSQKFRNDNLATAVANYDNLFLRKLCAVIATNFDDEKFDGNTTTNLLYISNDQLTKKTKALLNQTPNEVINNYRVDIAKELLRQPDLSVEEIAHQCGFSSPTYFTKVYEEIFKVSPTQHRNKLDN